MKNDKSTTTSLSIPELIVAYRKAWIWVVVSVSIFGFLAMRKYLTTVPETQVTAQIFISTENSPSFSGMSEMANLMGLNGSFGSNRGVHDEIEILESHALMLDIAHQFDANVRYVINRKFKKIPIYENVPVVVEFDKAISDTLSVNILFDVKVHEDGKVDISTKIRDKKFSKETDLSLPATITTPYGEFTIAAGPGLISGKSISESIMVSSYDFAAIALAQSVAIGQSNKKTDIIALNYSTNDPKYGKRLLNAIMESYNKLTVLQQQRHLQFILEFINHRLASLASELNLAEEGVEDFLARRELVDPETQAGLFISQNVRQEQELIKAENDHELLRLAIEFLSAETNNSSLLPIMPSIASLTPLIEGYNELILERIAIEPSARGENAALKAINIRIDAVKKNLMTALEKHYDMAKVQIEELRHQFAESKAKLETVPNMEREYVNIKRQQSLQEQLYMYLLKQREETRLNIAGSQPLGTIIDPAYVKPTLPPSPKIMMLMYLMIGAMLPAAFIIARWKLNGKINTIEQGRLDTGLEPIAELPILPSLRSLVVVSDPLSTASVRYRLLRSNLLSTFEAGKGEGKVIAVCSSTPKRPMSAPVGANLAASLCGAGNSVALVDANLFNPEVAEILEIPGQGILNSDINGDPAQPFECNLSTGYTPLRVITASPDPGRGADAVSSLRFRQLIADLRQSNDFVIIVLPSTDNYDALKGGSQLADTVVADIALGKTSVSEAKKLRGLVTDYTSVYFVALTGQK